MFILDQMKADESIDSAVSVMFGFFKASVGIHKA